MATSYSTPGVYVVEQSAFPPSVAQVPTAIPAFVGYTQTATHNTTNDLNMVPTKITSLLEYHTLFGYAAEPIINFVDLSADNTVSVIDVQQPYYMYDAIQMFYENGGGDCYIISVNVYGNPINEAELETGIDALKKKDEPSLLLFPDAALLDENDFYKIQKYALLHCATLQNRFCILDTFYSGNDDINFETSIDNHRTGLGVTNLSYGAVYTPWLQSLITGSYTYKDFHDKLTKFGVNITLLSLTTDATVSQIIHDYDFLISDALNINSAIEDFLGLVHSNDLEKLDSNIATILINYQNDESAFKLASAVPITTITVPANIIAAYRALINQVYLLAELLDTLLQTTVVVTADLLTDINQEIDNLATPVPPVAPAVAIPTILDNVVVLNNVIESDNRFIGTATGLSVPIPTLDAAHWLNANLLSTLQDARAAIPGVFLNEGAVLTPQEQVQNMTTSQSNVISKAFYTLFVALSNVITYSETAMATKEKSLSQSFPVYKNIVDFINNAATLLPPSGAVAGIYAYTDNNRGVWKAPANIQVNSVNIGSGVSIDITDDMQSTLNIDVSGGKSINAIRDFTGKGTLVWGARTLAGNDNDWRYVSVRRFCIMVEQSVKKSTSWAVFESNDANTWQKVKGMIENFLTLQWRNGALQGAKPADAFQVLIGLGQTMTAVDILEGRMNVTIKMAVVHPAEFIILTFTQMMATS